MPRKIDMDIVGKLSGSGTQLDLIAGDIRHRWFTIWTMLVGAYNLLILADDYLDDQPMDFAEIERFAKRMVSDWKDGITFACNDEWYPHPHSWLAGFHLMSAEHRIANALDRLHAIVSVKKLSEISKDPRPIVKKYQGIKESGCAYCKGACKWTEPEREALDLVQKGRPLDSVYERTNEYKHERFVRAADGMPTRVRSDKVILAFKDLLELFSRLIVHYERCSRVTIEKSL